jgi:hypothetical protein
MLGTWERETVEWELPLERERESGVGITFRERVSEVGITFRERESGVGITFRESEICSRPYV